MFDTTIVRGGGPSHVTVREHRAPTAETVRLLRELEAEAEKRVLSVYRCETACGLEAMIMERGTFDNPFHEYTLRYRLGESDEAVVKLDQWEGQGAMPDQEWLDAQLERLARSVAGTIMRITVAERLK